MGPAFLVSSEQKFVSLEVNVCRYLKNKISQINDANCENFSYYFQVDYLEGMT